MYAAGGEDGKVINTVLNPWKRKPTVICTSMDVPAKAEIALYRSGGNHYTSPALFFGNSTMRSSRSILFSFIVFCWGATVSAQTVPMQSQPVAQQRVQQAPIKQPLMQVQPMQASPVQAPPMGFQGAPSVYQTQPMAQPTNAQVPTGINMQPVRVATSNAPPVTGQSIPLYNPGDANRTPITVQPGAPPGAAQMPPPGMVHMGRSEPASRIIPFSLNPTEQQELDQFLARWERLSATIKRYDVEFDLNEYDMTVPGALPNQPQRITFGYFKYIATPMRFVYVIEGEWRDGKKIKRDGDKNPHIFAEKIIIDDKSVFKYDHNAKTVHQINVPPDMIGKGIADSPLPLIFGAKADDLKRRFSMKVVMEPNGIIRLFARPLLPEDQQEFKELEIMLDKDLRAIGLRQFDINDKAHKSYGLKSPKINDRLQNVLGDLKEFFSADVPRGWKSEVTHWIQQPPPAQAVPQVPMGSPYPQSPPRNEMPLYRGQ